MCGCVRARVQGVRDIADPEPSALNRNTPSSTLHCLDSYEVEHQSGPAALPVPYAFDIAMHVLD